MISVVLPVHNGARYLAASIESVLAQNLGDWELVIWDDGSTDESSEIIRRYADSRVRCFANLENRGLFPTLNAAIRETKGPLIRLWSQDDMMKPECLAVEVEFQARHPEIGMSYCQWDLIDETGRVIRPAVEDETPEVISPALAAQIMFYHGSITGNIANVLLKRSSLDAVGLFREDLRVAGDFEMWERISEKYPIGFLKQPLIYLRSHSGQFSRRKGVNVDFMRETRPIYRTLLERLPPVLTPYARRYYQRHQLMLQAHYVVRCLATGEWTLFRQAYRELAKSGNPLALLGLWALTLDHRLFRLEPRYLA